MFKKAFLILTITVLVFSFTACKKVEKEEGSIAQPSSVQQKEAKESEKPNEAELRKNDASYVEQAITKKNPKICDKMFDPADRVRCKERVKESVESAKSAK